MRRFNANIIIDGSDLGDQGQALSYETQVYHELLTVLDVGGDSGSQYRTGFFVLREIKKQVTIRPSLAQKYDADSKPVTDLQQHPVMITDLASSSLGDAPGADDTDDEDLIRKGRIEQFRTWVDQPGQGTTVTIRYSPDPWFYLDARRVGFDARKHRYVQVGGSQQPLDWNASAIEPDDILLHEMVHAARQTNGLWLRPTNNRFDDDYGSKEEFFAVLIANIYVSERSTVSHPRLLRGKYTFKKDGTDTMFHELDKALQTSEAFVDKYDGPIGYLCNDMPIMTDALSTIKAQFNPIRVWKARDYRRRNPPPDTEMIPGPIQVPPGYTPKF